MSEWIESIETGSGEFISMEALEVISVPNILILKDDNNPNENIEERVRLGFGTMLSEVYQSYRSILMAERTATGAVELLWTTTPVQNQPFKAEIHLYFVFRAIASRKAMADELIERMRNSCESVLRLYKYVYQQADLSAFHTMIGSVNAEAACTLIKDESVELLQNSMMNDCYSFGLFHAAAPDLSSVVNSLIDHPNCALSIQLVPTFFSGEELMAINQVAQAVTTLSNGIQADGVGNVSIAAAEGLSEVYRYYLSAKNAPLYQYGIYAYGDERAVEDIMAKMYGYLSFDFLKAPAMKHFFLPEGMEKLDANYIALPWQNQEQLPNIGRNQYIWGTQNAYANLYRMPYVITAEEASEIFRLPIGTVLVSAGLSVNETGSSSKTYGKDLINAGDITVGTLKTSGNRDTIGIKLSDLAKHMLVVGTPGSGKTTFSVGLLDRLWKEHHIPFLVIEPAKNEYRAMVQSIPDLQVFTPGKNSISPFVFNPFVPPKNVRLETYKSTLKTAFAAGVSMTTPLDKIFEESINNCYSDFRWLDTYTSDDAGQVFNISDFIKCFEQTFENIGYTGDAKNIGRAGVVRLKGLEKLFDNYFSIPIEDLLQKPTVIELAAIENNEEKALIIALLLLSILGYVNANYVGEGGLQNVILLEEAHVLLGDDGKKGEGEANPAAIAQGLVKRMLAEIRSYGVGVIIADQSPRKVTTDVVALTDMKLVFRQVEATDKEILADSMNMTEAQVQRLSRLKPGEAFLFFNRLDDPEEVVTPNYRMENKISISLSDDSIRELSTYWKSRGEQLRPYPECAMIPHCQGGCDYNRRILAKEIARRIFVRYFNANSKSFEELQEPFKRISSLVKAELNDEPFTPELLSCVKCQLFRKIKYGTQIRLSEALVRNSLEK